jgi:hypothetical protein
MVFPILIGVIKRGLRALIGISHCRLALLRAITRFVFVLASSATCAGCEFGVRTEGEVDDEHARRSFPDEASIGHPAAAHLYRLGRTTFLAESWSTVACLTAVHPSNATQKCFH